MNQTLENEVVIPDDGDVVASTSRKTWRFAKGKVCTGSEDGGTFEEREKIVGALRRVGIHDQIYRKADGDKRIYHVEADVETANGPLRMAASLCDMKGKDQPSGVAIAFVWGLLQLAKDEVGVWTATQGTKKNEFGSYPTFVNTFRLPAGKKQAVEVPRRHRVEGETMEESLAKLLAELREHPAYADRPASESDDEDGSANTHLSAFCKECAAKGWPTPEQAPQDWLAFVAFSTKMEKVPGSLREVDEEVWNGIRQALMKRVAVPDPTEARKKFGFDGPSDAWAKSTPVVEANAFG